MEFDLFTGRYKWDRFRTLARLEKKHDDTLTEYFQAFYHMCMRVCKKFKNDDDGNYVLQPYLINYEIIDCGNHTHLENLRNAHLVCMLLL